MSLLFRKVVGPNVPRVLKLLLWTQNDPIQLSFCDLDSLCILPGLQGAATPNHRQVGKMPGMKYPAWGSVIVRVQADHQDIGSLEMRRTYLNLGHNVVGLRPESVRHHLRQHLTRVRAENAKATKRAVHVVAFS